MANIFVRSTTGNDSNSGNSWANARATLANVSAVVAAGDTIFVSKNHSETHQTVFTLNVPSTSIATTKILCVDDTGDPSNPTELSEGATISTQNQNNIVINNFLYCYGLTFVAGNTNLVASIVIGTDYVTQTYEKCRFILNNTVNNSRIVISPTSSQGALVKIKNSSYSTNHVSQCFRFTNSAILMENLYYEQGNVSPTLFAVASFDYPTTHITLHGINLANCNSNINLLATFNTTSQNHIKASKITFPNNYTGDVTTGGITTSGTRVELSESNSGNTKIRCRIMDRFGSARDNVDIYASTTQYDGIQRFSYKVTGHKDCNNFNGMFECPVMHAFIDEAGTYTFTTEICHDGATPFKNNEVVLKLLLNDGITQSFSGNILTEGISLTSSDMEWTGATGTGPNGSSVWNKLKVSATVNIPDAGAVMGRVMFGKANTVVFIDPNLTITPV